MVCCMAYKDGLILTTTLTNSWCLAKQLSQHCKVGSKMSDPKCPCCSAVTPYTVGNKWGLQKELGTKV